MNKKELADLINNANVESVSTVKFTDFINIIVEEKFNELANDMSKKFNDSVEKIRSDFNETTEGIQWRRIDSERHALLVEEYMHNMNEILEKKL